MQPLFVALELVHQTGRRVGHGSEQCRLEPVQRVRAGEHVGDVPALRCRDRAAADGREQPRPDGRGLPAPARADDGEEPSLREALQELLDQLLTSEEVDGVSFFERAEALVRVLNDRAGDGRHEPGGCGSKRPSERHVLCDVGGLRP